MNSTWQSKRRRLLGLSSATAAAFFFGQSSRAFATVEELQQAIREFGEGAGPSPGGISLKIPEIAENGNSVAVSISADSPMTPQDHITAIMLLAPNNPTTQIALFQFTAMSGAASVTTRIRLAETQDVTALAKTNTGQLRIVSTHVKVTIGGCGS